MKRYVTVGVLLIITIALVFIYLRSATHTDHKRPLFDALPSNASLILSFPDAISTFSDLDSTSYTAELNSIPLIADTKLKLQHMDSMLSGLGYTLKGTPMLVSAHSVSKKETDMLYLVELAPSQSETFMGAIKGAVKHKERSFREHTIYDITSGIAAPLTMAYMDGILVVSSTSILVEEALLQLIEKPSLLNNAELASITNKVSEDVDLSVIISPSHLHLLDNMLLSEGAPFKADLHQWASWLALDVKLREKDIVLTGYATPSDTSFLSLNQHEATHVFDADKVMPGNTAFFKYTTFIGLNDTGDEDEWDLDNYFNELLNGELVVGLMESLDEDHLNDRFHLLKLTDVERTEQSLAELLRLNANEQEDVTSGQLKVGNAFDALFDAYVDIPNDPYFSIVGEYLLLAADASTIDRFIKNAEERSLYQTMVYQQFRDHVTSTSNVTIYVAPSLFRELLPIIFNEDITDELAENWSQVKDVNGAVLQFTSYEGMFFTNGYVQFNSGDTDPVVVSNSGDGRSIWRSKLDTLIHAGPWFVEDFTEKGGYDVVAQDLRGKFYYFDKSGKLLWDKELGELILGGVHQVDLYKNGKLQLVFNTESKIHLLDRLGNTVEQFPISLPAKAANGMLLVDYDGRRNYRYFVACDNYKIFGYYANGKPLPGWSPKARVGTIPYPMQHVLSDGKDYLIATNIDGTLLFFDRKADRRARPVRLKTGFDQPFALHRTEKGFVMTNVSRDRKLYIVNEAGDAVEQDLGELPEAATSAVLNVDGTSLIALVQKDKVTLINDTLGVVLEEQVEHIDLPAQVVNWPNGNQYLFLASAADNKVYLYDAEMKLYPGFPLNGTTIVDVVSGLFGDKDEYTIIVGDIEGYISAYRMR